MKVAAYKLSAAILNRKKAPGKVADGLALSFIRNKDASLTAWQRVNGKDVRVENVVGEITQDQLIRIRAAAYAIKTAGDPDKATSGRMTFAEAWESYRKQMAEAKNSRWAASTLKQSTARMLTHVSGTVMWSLPVSEITAAVIRESLATVRAEQPKLAPKVLGLISQVMAMAASQTGLQSNQALLLKAELKAIEKPPTFNKLPAITDIDRIGQLLHQIEHSSLYPTTRAALLLQAYSVQRSGEVAGARRTEFKFLDDGRVVWTISRLRMKVSEWPKKPYDQVLTMPVKVANLIKPLLSGDSDYLFTPRHGEADHITVEAFSMAFQRLGFRGVAVPHGWRSALKTLAEEAADEDDRPLFASSWIEGVLDHSPLGIAAHYQRGKLERGMERVLAWWAQLLEQASTAHRDKSFHQAT